MRNDAVMTAVRLRPAAGSDLPAVEALLREAGLPTDGVGEQFDDGFAVAEADGVVVGVAGVEVYGSYGLLRSVAVAEAYRGEAVGQRLLDDRLGWAEGRRLRAVYLLTTTAAEWFVARGFRVVGREAVPSAVQRSAEFTGTCPSTATALERKLGRLPVACCTPAPRGAQLARHVDSGDGAALKAEVRSTYGAAATTAAAGGQSSCCGTAGREWDPITADLYDAGQTQGLPAEALLASLGCGNPTALAELNPGDIVLDLGSGGGIDVLLSARRVGPTGRAYGLDMTEEMLALARENQARAGATNVEFLKGDIEAIPLPDAAVDVIISNCVINLAADKAAALREAFRVLKPGGRFAVSDIVARRDVPAAVRGSMELWMGCIAGALREDTYVRLLEEAGFVDVSIEPTRLYSADDALHFLSGAGLPLPANLEECDGAFMSGFVRGTKPVTG
jgi:arsenite methyltransferase